MRRSLGLGVLALLLSGCSVSIGFSVDSGASDIQPPPRSSSGGSLPEVAGGLSRAHDTEARIADQLAQSLTQLRPDAVVEGSLVAAVYHRPGIDPHNGDIVFMGGALSDPAPLRASLKGRPGNLPPGWENMDVDLGPNGGQGACAQGPNAAPSCIWVTDTSFGHLVPLVPPTGASALPDMRELAGLMQKMRPDFGS
jgi:hypothetical protein